MKKQAAKIAKIGSIAGIAIAALAVVLILPDAADVSTRGHVDDAGPTLAAENACPELLRQGGFCLDAAPTVGADDPYLDMLRQGDFYRNITPTISVDDPYLELLKQGDRYLDMAPGEQEAYVQAINEMRANHDAREREVWSMIDATSLLTLESQAAAKAGDQERADRIAYEVRALLTAYYTTATEADPRHGESLTAARDQIDNQTGAR